MIYQKETRFGDLKDLQKRPEALLTKEFKLHVKNPKATPFEGWIGSFDDGFGADLAVLISGEFKTPITEPNDPFYQALIRRHHLLSTQSLVPSDSNPAMLFIAHEQVTRSGYEGIDVLTIVLHPSLRRLGLGKAFTDNFEGLAWSMGYNFTFGDNSETRYLDGFLRNGSIPTSQLPPEACESLGIPFADNRTIRFNPRSSLKKALLRAS